MTGPRTYVVGLPVVVEVRDDGHVAVEVDLTELGSRKVLAEWNDYPPETITADADYLSAWRRTHRVIDQRTGEAE